MVLCGQICEVTILEDHDAGPVGALNLTKPCYLASLEVDAEEHQV